MKDVKAVNLGRLCQAVDTVGATILTQGFIKDGVSHDFAAQLGHAILEMDREQWVRSLPVHTSVDYDPYSIKIEIDNGASVEFERAKIDAEGGLVPIRHVGLRSWLDEMRDEPGQSSADSTAFRSDSTE